jgi:hypothetical protein
MDKAALTSPRSNVISHIKNRIRMFRENENPLKVIQEVRGKEPDGPRAHVSWPGPARKILREGDYSSAYS